MSLRQHKSNPDDFIRHWIIQHKPNSPRADHAGVLLVVGLFGMLDTLRTTDVYQLLKSLHDSTTISVLIGKAASMISSTDKNFT